MTFALGLSGHSLSDDIVSVSGGAYMAAISANCDYSGTGGTSPAPAPKEWKCGYCDSVHEVERRSCPNCGAKKNEVANEKSV